MTNKVGQGGGGAGGAKDYFTEGRGSGRGVDIANKRGAPKAHGRGVAGENRLEIDLDNLENPGVGPVNVDPKKGMGCLDDDGDMG